MKSKIILFLFSLIILSIIFYSGCTYDKPLNLAGSGYPSNIANIIVRKCAVAGCHNTQSAPGASGLDLTTWTSLFKGGNNGSSVIPYRPDFSYMMYFINTYHDLGPSLIPTMPYNNNPLTHDEVSTIKNWISQGAANSDGFVMWSDNPDRKKFYVLNQGCRICSVFDQQTKLVMRVVDVGDSANILPHEVHVSPDNKYWYVIFASGNIVEKFDASTDQMIAKIPIMGDGNARAWNSSSITPDGTHDFIIDWENNGLVAYVDLENQNTPFVYQGAGFIYPHGSTLNNNGNTLYITGLSGNFYYKMDVSDPINNPQLPQTISLNGQPPNPTSSLNSYDVTFTPDSTRYFLSCQGTGEVRMVQTSNDSLLQVFHVGAFAVELGISTSHPYLFVTCQEDTTTYPGKRGSVYIINYNTNTVIGSVFTGWQPHGIAVDDVAQLVYITNRNVNTNGPAPHHTTVCGRDGYVTIIDMNTLQLLPKFNIEVSSDPFDVSIRN